MRLLRVLSHQHRACRIQATESEALERAQHQELLVVLGPAREEVTQSKGRDRDEQHATTPKGSVGVPARAPPTAVASTEAVAGRPACAADSPKAVVPGVMMNESPAES